MTSIHNRQDTGESEALESANRIPRFGIRVLIAMSHHPDLERPSRWVERFATLLPSRSHVLDLACGGGRHSRLFAARGAVVIAVDRDAQAIERLREQPTVTAVCADLENGPWPFPATRFDAIVVTNYLHRPLFPVLCDSLLPGGLLVYETFMLGNERFGKPSNPDFLLRPGELLVHCAGLSVLAFEQGEIDDVKPAMIQRICAIRSDTPALRIP